MAVLNEEQTMLRDAAREWTRDNAPVSAFRKLRDSGTGLGYDPTLFAQMAEMGWAGVVIPEAYGGSDFGYLSLGLVLEETGRTLTASPLLASGQAAASALVLGGSDAQKSRWLPGIAAGEVVATLAVDEGPRHAPEKIAMKAERDGDGWRLTGAKVFVPEGMAANLFIVAARTAEGVSLFLVPADADGLGRTRVRTADMRGVASLSFEAVRLDADAELKGGALSGGALLEAVLDRARAGLSAEMLGMAVQAFETTLDYMKTRVQFGQTIGSFQALQHRAAEMFTELELTRSAVEAALAAIDAGGSDVAELSSLAKLRACETLHLVSNEMVQLHGGIGMTDEHDAGFYLKRARAAEATWGGLSYHRERFGRLNGF
ncbi:MAG: acyl-CoA dehydrogenase family protein [Caulobacteraceae bacterium]